MPPGWEQVERVLAIRLDNIGDVVMLSAALRALRDDLPHASVTLLASPAGAQVAPLLPWVDEVVPRRVVWQDASGALSLDPQREQALVADLASRGFDAAVIFTSFSQSAVAPGYACYLAGIPIRVGHAKEFAGGVLSHAVPSPPDDVHQVDRNLHLLAAAGFAVQRRDLELALPRSAELAAAALLVESGVGAGFVLATPGASAAARRYDAGRFGAALALLTAETGLRCVIAGSQREAGLVNEVAQQCGGVGIAGRTDVPAFAAVVGRATLVVTNNTSTMHIADALRRPQVVLYSGTELEQQWEPRFSPARLLRRPTACTPCYGFDCPYELECLDIPPAEVVAAGLALLEPACAP